MKTLTDRTELETLTPEENANCVSCPRCRCILWDKLTNWEPDKPQSYRCSGCGLVKT